jgi:hypothetical protein
MSIVGVPNFGGNGGGIGVGVGNNSGTSNSNSATNSSDEQANQSATTTSSLTEAATGTTNSQATAQNTAANNQSAQQGQNTTDTTGDTSQSSTTSSSQASIDQANQIASAALTNSTDPSNVNAVIGNIMNQAAISFAPTLASANSAGGYNSSTTQLLSGYAQGQAVAQSAADVLNYQTAQQGVANTANSNLLAATKTTTGDTTSTQDSINDILNFLSGSTNSGTATATTGSTLSESQSGTSGSTVLDQILSAITKSTTEGSGGSTSTSEGGSASVGGGGITSLLGSVICGELYKQGKMKKSWYYAGLRHFHFNYCSHFAVKGYYAFAVPAVKHMKKYPNGKLTGLLALLFNWRAEYVASLAGVKNARPLIRGQIIDSGLYWLALSVYLLGYRAPEVRLTQEV